VIADLGGFLGRRHDGERPEEVQNRHPWRRKLEAAASSRSSWEDFCNLPHELVLYTLFLAKCCQPRPAKEVKKRWDDLEKNSNLNKTVTYCPLLCAFRTWVALFERMEDLSFDLVDAPGGEYEERG